MAPTNSNSDSAIARLLYAMLKQRSLKDIDWNKVAQDPILLEEISNGHAARMRYSRFRAVVEKHGSSRPTRTGGSDATSSSAGHTPSAATKFKVTKPKPKRDTKEGKQSKETQKWAERRSAPEEESGVEISGPCQEDPDPKEGEQKSLGVAAGKGPGLMPFVKIEPVPRMLHCPSSHMQAFSPASLAQMSASHQPGDNRPDLQRASSSDIPYQLRTVRLLTPCSDADTQQQEVSVAMGREASGAGRNAMDFATAAAATAAVAAAHYNNSGSQGPCWIPPQQVSPFSPHLGTFDMTPYSTSLDTTGYAGSAFPQLSSHRTCTSSQDLEQSGLLANAFVKHSNGWNTMLNQVSGHDNPGGGHGCHGHDGV